MDSSKFIQKADENKWFATEAGPQAAHQYDTFGPGKLLEMIVSMCDRRVSNSTFEKYKSRLPEYMGYTDFDNQGRAVIGQVKKDHVDFTGPSGGQNASTVKGLGLIPLLAGDAIMEGATRMLGEYLHVTRVAYADLEPDNDRFTIRHDWTAAGAA